MVSLTAGGGLGARGAPGGNQVCNRTRIRYTPSENQVIKYCSNLAYLMVLKLYGMCHKTCSWIFLAALVKVSLAPLPSRPDAEVEPQTSEPKTTPFNTPDALEKGKLAKAPDAELKDNHQAGRIASHPRPLQFRGS